MTQTSLLLLEEVYAVLSVYIIMRARLVALVMDLWNWRIVSTL